MSLISLFLLSDSLQHCTENHTLIRLSQHLIFTCFQLLHSTKQRIHSSQKPQGNTKAQYMLLRSLSTLLGCTSLRPEVHGWD